MSENENDLTARGITAYEAGNKKEAAQYLSQAAREDKSNERGLVLSRPACQRSEKRRQCLENVLKLNPDHAEARAELDQLLGRILGPILPNRETEPSSQLEATPVSGASPAAEPPQPEEPAPEAAAAPADTTATADDTSPDTIPLPRPEPQSPEGLSLPLLSAIPGAPEVITIEEVSTSAATLLPRSMEILAGHETPRHRNHLVEYLVDDRDHRLHHRSDDRCAVADYQHRVPDFAQHPVPESPARCCRS
jgi:hypothetical protein